MNPMYNEREGEYSIYIKKKTCRQECSHADSEALCVRGWCWRSEECAFCPQCGSQSEKPARCSSNMSWRSFPEEAMARV